VSRCLVRDLLHRRGQQLIVSDGSYTPLSLASFHAVKHTYGQKMAKISKFHIRTRRTVLTALVFGAEMRCANAASLVSVSLASGLAFALQNAVSVHTTADDN